MSPTLFPAQAYLKAIQEACAYITRQIEAHSTSPQTGSKSFRPQYGIILGTGLSQFVDKVQVDLAIPYTDIPHFMQATAETHHGRLLLGHIGDAPIVLMQGRFHYYEGYSMQEITFPVRVMHALGIQDIFISNIAGALNPTFEKSDLMLITDHLDLLADSPLRGEHIEALGPRYPDMSEAYHPRLQQLAMQVAAEEDIRLHTGIYAACKGPQLETPAEYAYLQRIGADAVGMSTVPEVVVAAQLQLRCCACSIITDLCYPGALEKIDVPAILAAAAKAEPQLVRLLQGCIQQCFIHNA